MENAKNLIFGKIGECFWHIGRDFWQITDVIVSGKPLNRAFHGYLWNAKNFKFGRSGDGFGKVFGIYGKVFGILEEIFWQWIYYRLEENHQDCFILPKTGRRVPKIWLFGILGKIFGRLQM